jgi:hypothetical protein
MIIGMRRTPIAAARFLLPKGWDLSALGMKKNAAAHVNGIIFDSDRLIIISPQT